jgi:alkylated DNA nucleotide flippase Atl1
MLIGSNFVSVEREMAGEVKSAVVQVVQRIPEGAVTNYGEVAKVVSGIV